MPRMRATAALYTFALVALATIAFWPGLTGGFLFDDFSNIVREQTVHAEEINLKSMALAAKGYAGPIGRPLATISFAIDHSIWGIDAWGFKLTNVILHALNALLAFLLLRTLLPLSNAPVRWGVGAAFAVAMIWAIHPLQVSTVLYVVQRMEMLSATFVMLALWAYLIGRRRQIEGQRGWHWLAACVPLVGLGAMCKESAVLFPAYTLALEITVLGFAARSPATARTWRVGYITATTVALLVLALVVVPHYATPETYMIRDYSVVERLLTQLRVLTMYLGWIVLPRPASYVFYYDSYVVSQGLMQPVTTLISGLLLLGLAAAAWVLRKRMPMFCLGILWFFAAHLLTSNVIPLELVFEHRNYFAMLGVLISLSELVRRLPASEVPRIREVAVAIVIVGMLGLTLIRSATWGNSLGLAMEFSTKNPNSSRASMDLGEHYLLLARNDPKSRHFKLGIDELERGSRVPDASLMPEQGLIVYSASAGLPAQPEWWDRVVSKLNNRAIGPQEIGMITDLMRMRNEGVDFDDKRFADAYLVLVNRIDMPGSQYYFFGEHALKKLNDRQLAISLFEMMVDKSVDEPEFVAAIVDTIAKDGYPDVAQSVAFRASQLGIADIVVDTSAAESGTVEEAPSERTN